MREIKFRAWYKEANQMLNVMEISFIGEEIDTYEMAGDWLGFDYVELMQYTGLKDKHGTEIYEGDILDTDLERPYVIVEFRNGCFVYNCFDDGKSYYDIMHHLGDEISSTKYHKVIGNIYENPELLEVGV